MAFGFFKKADYADVIFYNGHIYTQDPELPWAEAVACKGEKILGVGNLDGMETVTGPDTRLVDLDGRYLLPGFIDVHRSPVLRVFDGKYLDLSECSTTEEVLEAVAAWAEENPDNEIVFGYGYRDDLKPDDIIPEETESEPEAEEAKSECEADGEATEDDAEQMSSASILSEVCSDRPVLLLCANGMECWTNDMADEIIVNTAEEEYVQTITTSYALNLLIPFDFEEIEEAVRQEIEDLSDSGFTSVLSLGMPDYLENLYQDSIIGLYNEGRIRQRFFGSYFLNRPLRIQPLMHKLMEHRTTCIEMNGLLNARTLNLYLCNETSPVPFTQSSLDKILEEVSDKSFDIFIEAISYDDLLMAYDALEHIRARGYKNSVTIASDYELSASDSSERPASSEACKTWGTNLSADRSIYGKMTSSQEVIDQLTLEAARILGMSESLGSIETGKLADFAIFDENPLDCELKLIHRLHACMTVLGGEIVYDVDAENDMQMYDLMMSQQY